MNNINLNKGTACNYELIFPLLPHKLIIGENKEFILNVHGTIIPSVALEPTDSDWQGKKMHFHVGGITFSEWTINYIVDSELKNWKLLFDWLMYITDNSIKPTRPVNEYMVDASLLITNNYHETIQKVMFKNIWPISLGEITLSNREGEAQLEGDVTFSYDRYEVV